MESFGNRNRILLKLRDYFVFFKTPEGAYRRYVARLKVALLVLQRTVPTNPDNGEAVEMSFPEALLPSIPVCHAEALGLCI